MTIIGCVLAGYILDLIIGDPHGLPHPIILIGNFISLVEKLLRKLFPKNNKGEFVAGFFLLIIVVFVTFSASYLILKLAYGANHYLGMAVEAFLCYQIFATKSLKKESMRVYDQIKKNDLNGARKYLSWIVGRDTENLDYEQITKAVVETIAENTSDGVIAPMLFMVIGGAPLGFLYKAINTLDSMVGYKNDKYMYLGRCSAIVDDIANYIPARITGLLFVISSMFIGLDYKNSLKILKRDRRNHASPNSAYPESACAGALNIQLAGDAYYFGKLYQKKTIGDNNREINMNDIVITNKLMYVSSVIAIILTLGIRGIILAI